MAGLPEAVINTGINTAKDLEILHTGIQFIKAIHDNDLENAAHLLKHIEL